MKESPFASAVRLVEDALVLAKRMDSAAWLIYLAGVVPFFGLLLFELTDLAQNPFALQRLPVAALTLALLYCWLHICQSVFCACLQSTLTETDRGLRSKFAQAFAIQPALAASKLILWPVTLCLVILHPVVTMFYQHSLVPQHGFEGLRSVLAQSKRDALYRQGQAAWMLLLILLLRAILWINLFFLLLALPSLWKTFSGIEGKLTRAPDLLLNPASLATLSVLAYIGLDPIVKAACVLRRFTRESEASGLDLRLRISLLRRAAAALVLVCALCAPPRLHAAPPQPSAVSPDQMRDAINRVFHDPRNTWDLPVIQPRKPASGPFTAFMDSLADRAGDVWKAITTALSNLLEALRRALSNSNQTPETDRHPVSNIDGWSIIAVFSLVLVAMILVAFWNRTRRPQPQAAAATELPAQPIDLASEDLHAIDQPEDEWLKLARRHRAAGNLRLALRASYLSTLAAFGRTGLISLARGKTNLDYLRELQRRAKRFGTEFVPLFRSNLGLFEQSWYGDHAVTEETFELFERNSSTLRSLL